jgi:ribonuclease P/MRP protein subunit POP5
VKYLSQATSTFILRISRDHYRLVWAALSFMHKLPFKDGRPCVYRVVRVSGTIRKVEEEAVRRAKLFILAAKEEMAGKPSSGALDALLRGKDSGRSLAMVVDQDNDDLEDDDLEMEVDG